MKPTDQTIIIKSNGVTTTAIMAVNGNVVKTTVARRNPADKPNFRTGAQVAFDRLWQKQEKPEKPTKQTVKAVKRHAEVGEYVRITNKLDSANCRYENGKVYKVFDEFNELVWLSCGGIGALDNEYVVLEGYKPGSDRK